MFGEIISAVTGGHFQNQENRHAAREQRGWEHEEAAINRNWQERMSNSAHQRQVQDLRAAGLNPILSANSGASSPAGSKGSGAVQAPAEDAIGKGVTTALDLKRMKQELRQIESTEGLQKAQATAAYAQATREATTAANNEATTRLLDATFGASKAKAQTEEQQQRYNQRFMDFDNLNQRIQQGLTTLQTGKDAVMPGIKMRGGDNLPNPTRRGTYNNKPSQQQRDEWRGWKRGE